MRPRIVVSLISANALVTPLPYLYNLILCPRNRLRARWKIKNHNMCNGTDVDLSTWEGDCVPGIDHVREFCCVSWGIEFYGGEGLELVGGEDGVEHGGQLFAGHEGHEAWVVLL